jgi:cation diffusion facilitator family transporter
MSRTDNNHKSAHDHVFLGVGHERNERRTWVVIALCLVMMTVEIVGGIMYGSIALVADGLHMSTHAGALLLAAIAYSMARRYAHDPRFSFGTGKLGDLAGFTSAIVLAMIAMLIGYESVMRFLSPTPIAFSEAIPIAVLGLIVNIVSAWLLSGGHHDHHSSSHSHGHTHEAHGQDEDVQRVVTNDGVLLLSIHEDNVPPRFRLRAEGNIQFSAAAISVETIRPNGVRQNFVMIDRGGYFESNLEVPEPHRFTACVCHGGEEHAVVFEEHDHDASHHRDNNMRAAVIHVIADAAVAVLVIIGLVLARLFGWLWMDPLAGLIGSVAIAVWSYGLIRDTGAILLDMTPDLRLAELIRSTLETGGDSVADLHLWRLGPGHLGAIVAIETVTERNPDYYRSTLGRLPALSHLTVEVTRSLA